MTPNEIMLVVVIVLLFILIAVLIHIQLSQATGLRSMAQQADRRDADRRKYMDKNRDLTIKLASAEAELLDLESSIDMAQKNLRGDRSE